MASSSVGEGGGQLTWGGQDTCEDDPTQTHNTCTQKQTYTQARSENRANLVNFNKSITVCREISEKHWF